MAQLFWLSGQSLVDGTGAPYALAKANFYVTGTSTRLDTYNSAGLSVANANPVVADSDGRFPPIYLAASRYKVVLTDANDVQIGDDLDPVDGLLALIASASAPSPTYAFMRYWNTTDGNVYRRNSTNSAWINEGPVDGLGNAASVTQQLAGTTTSAFSTPDSVAALWQRGSDLASASTLSLPAAGGGVFNVTGTTGITGISSAQGGRRVLLRFAAALTLTHNGTSFILPGAANISTEAGDVAEFVNEAATDAAGSNWRCVSYQRASGRALINGYAPAAKTGNYTATTTDRGSAITFSGMAADVTLSLPTAASFGQGNTLWVINDDSSNWAVTIDPSGSETLDGFATRKTWPRSKVGLISDGSNWRTISGKYRAVSTAAVPALGVQNTVTHGFGVRPVNVWAIIICTSANAGYSVGDVVVLNPNGAGGGGATQAGVGVFADSTQIGAIVSTSNIQVPNKGTGTMTAITLSSWTIQVLAEVA